MSLVAMFQNLSLEDIVMKPSFLWGTLPLNSKKKTQKKQMQLQHANDELNKRNRDLGHQNEQLKSKVKALEADIQAKTQALGELVEKEKAAVTIVAQPEDQTLKMLEKVFTLTQDDRVHKQLTDEERAQTALKLQKEFLEQQHEAAKKEIELLNSRPEVIEAKKQGDFRRRVFVGAMILGGILIFAGVIMIMSITFKYSDVVIYAGSGLIGTGAIMVILGIGPAYSVEDVDKVERLSKVFKTKLPLPPDSDRDGPKGNS